MKAFKRLRLRVRKRIVHPFLRRIYLDADNSLRTAIMIVGSGRSGTTWLAEMLASKLKGRIIFEPFNSNLLDGLQEIRYLQYLDPTSDHDFLYEYCQRIFSGAIRKPKLDLVVETLRPEYRIVKSIRAGMFLKWIHVNFPNLPLLFILRHPCAVVQSRMECGWDGDMDVEHILNQNDLMEDVLFEHMELIKGAVTEESKHAIAWCVTNLVPLRQFPSGALPIIFYENLCERPDEELGNALEKIGLSDRNLSDLKSERPSFTSLATSAILTGEDRLRRWKTELSSSQINEILAVVKAFGLDHLYGDSVYPLRSP